MKPMTMIFQHQTSTPRTSVVKSQRAKPMAYPEAGEHVHKHFLQLAFIVLASMVGMVMFLCAVSLLIRYLYARRYSRTRNQIRRDTEDSPTLDNDDDVVVHPIWYIRTEGLQQSLIDSITVFKYRKQEGIIHGTECSVCLGEFEDEDSLRLLPKCSHAFHIPCIDTWLTSHQNCPFCRAPVTIPAVHHNNHTVSDHQTHRTDHQTDEVRGVSSNSSPPQVELEKQPLRRSVSVGSSSAALVDLDTHAHYSREKVNTSAKDMTHIRIEKHGGVIGCSTSTAMPVHKLASIGLALQKKPVSMRRSFSQNTNFLFSRHARSQSSTLPL